MKIATTIGEMFPYADYDPAKAIRLYEGTGFTALDYSFYKSIRPDSPFLTDDWLREVEEAAEAAAQLGFTFVQAHSPDYNPLGNAADTEYHEIGMRATLRSIEACGRLGIPNIVVHTGYDPQMLYPDDKETYFWANMPFIEALYPAMEKWHVRVCIENSAEANMGKSYAFMTAEDMNDFLDYADHPLLGACWDTGHGILRGIPPYQELTGLGKNLHAIHFHDNNGQWDSHGAPFFGVMDVDSVMCGLYDIGFTGPLTFEANDFLPFRNDPAKGVLGQTPVRLKQASLAMLYQIGVTCLEAYGIEVE